MDIHGQESGLPDQAMLDLYARNLTHLAHAPAHRVLFVPQLLSKEAGPSGQLRWWIPYVADEALLPLLDSCNGVMRQVAEKNQVEWVDPAPTGPWSAADFVDVCHLNRAGNLKLAAILAEQIRSGHQ